MSRTQTRAFDLLLNTRDSNCKKLGLATYRYYLNEPVQLLKKKFECGVKLIYMPNKTKTIDFSYGTSQQIKVGTLSTGKCTSIAYNGILQELNSVLQSEKIEFQYRHSKFSITNKRNIKEDGDLFISVNLLREFGFTDLLQNFDEVTAHRTTIEYRSMQITEITGKTVVIEQRISALKSEIKANHSFLADKEAKFKDKNIEKRKVKVLLNKNVEEKEWLTENK